MRGGIVMVASLTNGLPVQDGDRIQIDTSIPLRAQMAAFEIVCVKQALRRADGVKKNAAAALGLTREGLYTKMMRLGIQAPRQPARGPTTRRASRAGTEGGRT